MATPKKRIVALVAALAVIGGGVYGYREWAAHKPADGDIVLYGNIDIREVDLAFDTEGRVETMVVEEGDEVRHGQLIATLDASRYEATVAAAKARVEAQKAVVERLVNGSRPEEIKRAREEVKRLEAELHNARTTLKRIEKLAIDRFAPQQQLDDARTAVKSLEAQLEAAKQTLALAIEGPRKEDIAAAKATLAALEADLERAKRDLAYTELYSTTDGVVLARITEPGTVVLRNSPAYTVALSDPMWVRTFAPEPELGRIYPGMPARVYTDSAPDVAHEGWVGYISPVAEFTPKTVETPELRTRLVYRLRVYIHNPDKSLRQGMPVTVHLTPREGLGSEGAKAPASKTGSE